jgi:hypothetical protein
MDVDGGLGQQSHEIPMKIQEIPGDGNDAWR